MSDYDVGHDDGFKSGVRETTRILTDLIAELRATHKQGNWCEMDCCSSCTHCECNDSWPCDEIEAADRAEARLNELNGVIE